MKLKKTLTSEIYVVDSPLGDLNNFNLDQSYILVLMPMRFELFPIHNAIYCCL